MPTQPDCASKVIHGKTGYVRDNSSWILGRIIRDYEYWMPGDARAKLENAINEAHAHDQKQAKPGVIVPRPSRAGLFVSVFEASTTKTAGEPALDIVWASGIVVAIVQIGVACIPFGLFGDWSILMTTVIGIALAFASGSLPQWKREKWSCRRNVDQDYILTRGNGSQHAIVILGRGHGLNLEDLAASDSNTDAITSWYTRGALVVLACLWIALLIFASGLFNNTWFLLAVGGLGILHNAAVAGWPRKPDAFGLHLEPKDFIAGPKVMPVLMETERRYPHVGDSMLQTFFPGKLWATEEQEWTLLRLEALAHDAELKAKKACSDLEDLRSRPSLVMQGKTLPSYQDEIDEIERKAENADLSARAARTKAREAREKASNLKRASHAPTV